MCILAHIHSYLVSLQSRSVWLQKCILFLLQAEYYRIGNRGYESKANERNDVKRVQAKAEGEKVE
jgi:hypothetical protein